MNHTRTYEIWKAETGITDIENAPDELSASEVSGIKDVWTEQQKRLKGTTQLSHFTEKLNREWAIETGVIENLYEIDRGVTQTLIEKGFQAELMSHGSTNKPREYVIQLLRDQKETLEGIFDFVQERRELSVSYIKELHAVLLRSQETVEGLDTLGRPAEFPLIKGAWKKQPNYPVRDGTTYTYSPPEQVESEMDRLISIHNKHIEQEVPTEVQAAWLHHRFSQIHPFQDGNGRVARAITTLVLIKDNLFPMIVAREDKSKYINALEAADNGNLKPLIVLIVKLQMMQFRKATAISETVLAEGDVQAAIDGLSKEVDERLAERLKLFRKVLDLAHDIENDIEKRLNDIKQKLADELSRLPDNAQVSIKKSDKHTDHYFRVQVIEHAKHLDYSADTSEYRSWVALNIHWSRSAQLVFSIHGLGKPFNGSLICAPFLNFKDTDEDGERRSTLVPIAEEGFVFFFTEDKKRLLSRFAPWRDNVLTVALTELTRNL